MRLSLLSLAFAPVLFALACSSSSDGSPNTPAGDNDAGTTANDTGGTTGALKFKTHVILGDSISDGGGMGPFFYDLLDQDLKGLYGDIKVEKHSKAGATSSNLGGQITTIPATLEGPVLVTITIGGNDVTQAMPALLTGGTDDKARADFQSNLDDAFKTLTTPDKFGAGVKVTVLIANIYDPSDGTGNFKFASGTKCPGALQYWPAGKQTSPLLDKWEQVMTNEAAKFPGVEVVDLRAKFNGHGVPAAETWFYNDCIHPNTPGHSSVRDLFLDATKKL